MCDKMSACRHRARPEGGRPRCGCPRSVAGAASRPRPAARVSSARRPCAGRARASVRHGVRIREKLLDVPLFDGRRRGVRLNRRGPERHAFGYESVAPRAPMRDTDETPTTTAPASRRGVTFSRVNHVAEESSTSPNRSSAGQRSKSQRERRRIRATQRSKQVAGNPFGPIQSRSVSASSIGCSGKKRPNELEWKGREPRRTHRAYVVGGRPACSRCQATVRRRPSSTGTTGA